MQKVIEARGLFPKAVFMVQDEVARRLTGAKPSLLGISASFYYRVRYVAFVPKGCFWPKPKVDSAILSFERIEPLLVEAADQEELFDAIRLSFTHRRKTVLHSLQQKYSKQALVAAFDRSTISHSLRPEEMEISLWVELIRPLFFKTELN